MFDDKQPAFCVMPRCEKKSTNETHCYTRHSTNKSTIIVTPFHWDSATGIGYTMYIKKEGLSLVSKMHYSIYRLEDFRQIVLMSKPSDDVCKEESVMSILMYKCNKREE